LQGSMLSRLSAPGVRERSFSSVAESLLGMPLRGLHLSAGDGAHQPRLVAEGLAGLVILIMTSSYQSHNYFTICVTQDNFQ
jgi:hypothetical protein